jgi:hypothetical protein
MFSDISTICSVIETCIPAPRREPGKPSGRSFKMSVRIEVIPWETKAGQFGVAIWHDETTETYFVGSRSEAEREAQRRRGGEDRGLIKYPSARGTGRRRSS